MLTRKFKQKSADMLKNVVLHGLENTQEGNGRPLKSELDYH